MLQPSLHYKELFSVALIFIVNTVGLNSSREKDAIYWLIYKNWNSISWLKGKALDYKFSQIGSTDKTLSIFMPQNYIVNSEAAKLFQ